MSAHVNFKKSNFHRLLMPYVLTMLNHQDLNMTVSQYHLFSLSARNRQQDTLKIKPFEKFPPIYAEIMNSSEDRQQEFVDELYHHGTKIDERMYMLFLEKIMTYLEPHLPDLDFSDKSNRGDGFLVRMLIFYYEGIEPRRKIDWKYDLQDMAARLVKRDQREIIAMSEAYRKFAELKPSTKFNAKTYDLIRRRLKTTYRDLLIDAGSLKDAFRKFNEYFDKIEKIIDDPGNARLLKPGEEGFIPLHFSIDLKSRLISKCADIIRSMNPVVPTPPITKRRKMEK